MADFKVKINRRDITTEEVLEDIRSVAKKLNKEKITSLDYDQYGQFGKTTVLRKIGSWNEALKQAGLEVINRQNIPEAELMETFVNVWQKLGRQPVGKDFKNNPTLSQISFGTFESRYGSWTKFLLKFKEYIEIGKVALTPSTSKDTPKNGQRRTNRTINFRLRYKILHRDNFSCKKCGASPAKDPKVVLHVDHIKPWAKGGETEEDNLEILCSICNIGKSDDEY